VPVRLALSPLTRATTPSTRALAPLLVVPFLVLALLGLGPVASAEERDANTGTTRIASEASEWLDVGLDVNGVEVDRIRLHQAGKIKRLFMQHDEANRGSIVVTNRTNVAVHPAVAVAVFDAEGRLLAAANTGKKLISLKPGVSDELDIHFGGVFRHIEDGAFLYVSLEY